MLVAQLFSRRAELNRRLFDDRWHQLYRVPLVPGLSRVLERSHPDLLGVCLSGAGPSILALVQGSASEIGESIQEILRKEGVQSQVHTLAADNQGAKGWCFPK